LLAHGKRGKRCHWLGGGARAWSTGGKWQPAVVYRGAGAAAERAALADDYKAARADAADAARDAAALAASIAFASDKAAARALGNGAALARLHRLAEVGGAGVSSGAGVLQVEQAIGAAAMVAAAAAAVGHGRQECIDDWNAGSKSDPDEPFYNTSNVHCLGVAAGPVTILEWQDIEAF